VETLIVERSPSGVVTVTLDRPAKKNAINEAMWDELLAVLREIDERTDDRCVVITGAGDGFCSGADLGGETQRSQHQLHWMHHIHNVAFALHHLPKPTIAKVNGVAAGAGLNLALGCDLIVASDRARFSEIFARRGLTIDFGGSWLLPRLVVLHKAKELAFFADIIDAQEAERIGLVNRVVAHDELDAFVADWAERLAAGPPLALAMTKRLLGDATTSSFAEALAAEGLAQTVNFASEDTVEAIRAFLGKRTPTFKGR
jgi:2-(1,2-epoxy-1,2-dihydrophenyl)acetyl-CoA isomerase